MSRLFIALVAAVAMLAFASVAYSQEEGAHHFDCADHFPTTSGTIVITPSGNANFNCTYNHPRPSHGGGAIHKDCGSWGLTGKVMVTPSGHFKSHCKPAESS